jgi:ribulose kinase
MLGHDRSTLPKLIADASQRELRGDGVIVLDDFMGNRTPFRDAAMRGGMLGLSLATTAAEVYQATVHSVAFGTKQVLDSFQRAGIDVSDLYFSGGIGHNPLWLQTTADVVGYPIHSITSENLTLIATAASAAVGAGAFDSFDAAQRVFRAESAIVHPDAVAHTVLSEKYARYSEAKQANRGLFADAVDGTAS